MAEQTDNYAARLEIESCGQLGLWIKIDGKIADLISFSDLLSLYVLKPETKELIQDIYDNVTFPGDEEE